MLAAAARAAAAWKNGGGVTREVAVHPAGSVLGSFEWRVSIAEIHRGGPFSVFAGIDRHLAVLDGQVSLAVEGRTLSLSADSAPLTFGGELPVYAEPTAGPVIDLNLMVRRGRWRAELSRHVLPQAGAATETKSTKIEANPSRGRTTQALHQRDRHRCHHVNFRTTHGGGRSRYTG